MQTREDHTILTYVKYTRLPAWPLQGLHNIQRAEPLHCDTPDAPDANGGTVLALGVPGNSSGGVAVQRLKLHNWAAPVALLASGGQEFEVSGGLARDRNEALRAERRLAVVCRRSGRGERGGSGGEW